MSVYATQLEVQKGLDKKIDKTAISNALAGYPSDTKVASEKLVSDLFSNITYPANLEKCLNEFDNMYLGYKATHPTIDINGKALSTGLMYFNTTDKILYVYSGSAWVKTIDNTVNQTLEPFAINNFDVEATTATNTIVIPSGYNKDNVSVYLNGIRMSTADYTATDNATISFTTALTIGDVVSGFSSDDDLFLNFDVEANGTMNTITIPTGYDPQTVSVYLNGVRMSIADYTATNGVAITFTTPINAGDVVNGFSIKQQGTTALIVTEYDKIENAPNPAKNGALAYDISRKDLFYYSATASAWVGYKDSSEGGDISFFDKFDDFPNPTVALLDTLYVDRSNKALWFFDGTVYQPYGVQISTSLPTANRGTGALYVDTMNETLSFWDGTSFNMLANGKSEPIQSKSAVGDFIYSGVQSLFLDTTGSRLYHYDGLNFIPIKSAGAGNIEFIDDVSGVNAQDTLFLKKDNGKLYYYEAGETQRANKELWRIATDTDLVNAIKDEDFIYLIDDTNVLKKWDDGANRFETLGTPKVTHYFAKKSDFAPLNTTPTRAEVNTYVASKGYTDCILWGNDSDNSPTMAKWAYSVDENGEAVIVYSQEMVSVNGFCNIPTEQVIGGSKLIITMTNGAISIDDGGGATLNIDNVSSNGNLADGSSQLQVLINGVKVPYIDCTLTGNTVTVKTDRVIIDDTLYVDNFIEIIK